MPPSMLFVLAKVSSEFRGLATGLMPDWEEQIEFTLLSFLKLSYDFLNLSTLPSRAPLSIFLPALSPPPEEDVFDEFCEPCWLSEDSLREA